MTKTLAASLLASLVAVLVAGAVSQSADKAGPTLAHMVSVGNIAEDSEEPVSVKDFEVALHVVFRDKAAKEAYLVHPPAQELRGGEQGVLRAGPGLRLVPGG